MCAAPLAFVAGLPCRGFPAGRVPEARVCRREVHVQQGAVAGRKWREARLCRLARRLREKRKLRLPKTVFTIAHLAPARWAIRLWDVGGFCGQHRPCFKAEARGVGKGALDDVGKRAGSGRLGKATARALFLSERRQKGFFPKVILV
ncbi:MAG: hypothetical protein IKM62_04505 [Kiritimatiellae bacterium]|nr:hypothetical protein [Kiritimatiellia bacterium]